VQKTRSLARVLKAAGDRANRRGQGARAIEEKEEEAIVSGKLVRSGQGKTVCKEVREVVSKNTQAQGKEMDEGVGGKTPASSFFALYRGLVRSLSHDNRTIGFPKSGCSIVLPYLWAAAPHKIRHGYQPIGYDPAIRS